MVAWNGGGGSSQIRTIGHIESYKRTVLLPKGNGSILKVWSLKIWMQYPCSRSYTIVQDLFDDQQDSLNLLRYFIRTLTIL